MTGFTNAPKIFDDFLAYHLLTEDSWSVLEPLLAMSLQLYDPECAALCPDHATLISGTPILNYC